MKLSVITICYNEPDVEKTCESIVNQTYKDFEWIVIDGGSNEQTLSVLNKYRDKMVVFVSEKDEGIYNAMNKGIKLAKGEYLNFLNAGDMYFDNSSLETAAKHLEADIVYGNLEFFNENKKFIQKFPDKIPYGWFVAGYLPHPATFIKKELFDKYGLYNEKNKIVSDWEKWIEFIDINHASYLHIPFVISSHNHQGVSSVMNEAQTKERNAIIEKYYGTEASEFKKKKYIRFLGIPLLKIVKNYDEKKYYLFGFLPFAKIKEIDTRLKIYFLGIKVLSFTPKSKCGDLKINSSKGLCIYFDHIYGGGAEFYFYSKLKEALPNKTVIRIQELRSNYKISIYSNENIFEIFYSWNELKKLLLQINNSEIYINNLVGYKRIYELLNFLAQTKINNNKIMMLGHDYFPICTSWNLINNKGEYCDIPSIDICKKCAKNNSYVFKKHEKEFKKIEKWKNIWGNFLNEIADELIVFSQSSKALFTKAYPELENKIKIVQHTVKEFKDPIYYEKSEDNTVNIAMIGNICFIKGSEIVSQMAQIIKQDKYKNIKLTVIGDYNESDNVEVTGKYDREALPQILNKNKANIVFIPSICPETFSYTTSEAMTLKYPVACFNLGAPAQRVKDYKKGLVISKMDAQTALDEIINFVKK